MEENKEPMNVPSAAAAGGGCMAIISTIVVIIALLGALRILDVMDGCSKGLVEISEGRTPDASHLEQKGLLW